MEVKVTVVVHAKKEKIVSEKDGTLMIMVKEKGERNMANRRVRELVAEHFNVSSKAVRIVAGVHAPKKRVTIIT